MHHEKVAVLGLAVSILLAGCGGDDAASAKSSQVVAKINNTEVTVHQLNYELGLLGPAAPKDIDKVAGQVLENIINQQIVMQKAIDEKLDRDPQIMQSLERAKRQVLGQAYISKAVGKDITPPGKQGITEYYNQNPNLFAKRRIYQIREILLDKTVPFAEIQSQMSESKSLEKLVEWLESKKIKMQSAVVVKPAEQLPMEMLSRLAQMKQGQVMAFETPTNFSLSFLMGVREQPLSEAQAAPSIERFLMAQKRDKLVDAEVKRLRKEAKVELLGKFAGKGPEKTPTVVAPAPQKNTDKATEDAEFIRQGIPGL